MKVTNRPTTNTTTMQEVQEHNATPASPHSQGSIAITLAVNGFSAAEFGEEAREVIFTLDSSAAHSRAISIQLQGMLDDTGLCIEVNSHQTLASEEVKAAIDDQFEAIKLSISSAKLAETAPEPEKQDSFMFALARWMVENPGTALSMIAKAIIYCLKD